MTFPDLPTQLAAIAQALEAAPVVRWLVSGPAALTMHGVPDAPPPAVVDLVCAPDDQTRVLALLAPFAGGLPVRVLPGEQVAGPAGQLELSVARLWPRRATVMLAGRSVPLVPLEELLLAALLRGDQATAMRIARHLHPRGYDPSALSALLSDYPALAEPLWEVLDAVWPIARRARRRQVWRAQDKPGYRRRRR